MNDLRVIVDGAELRQLSLGIVFWAYSRKRKARFDEAARLALDDEDRPPARGRTENHREGEQP